MEISNSRKEKIWFILNSTFYFLSAFIFVKGLVDVSRFIVMRYFHAWVHLLNFDLVCLNGPHANIWNQTSVIIMYGVGFLVSLLIFIFSTYLFQKFKSKLGTFKLFITWVYIISLNQSFGVIIRDIPLRREFYHALNWMYLPYAVMIAILIFAIILLFIFNNSNANKFLRVANSLNEIRDNKSRRKTYTQVALFPALLGSAFISLLHPLRIDVYEVIELFLIVFFLCVPYIMLFAGQIPSKIKIFKEEKSKVFNLSIILLFALLMTSFLIVKFVFFTF